MELDEVVGRIFGRHKILLIVCVLLGVLAGLALHWRDKPLYAGSARLVIGSADPTTSAQAQALADTARGIASGTSTVAAALQRVGADRDPVATATYHVDVQPLGSSGVLQLTVTDPDPTVALALAGVLAKDVVDTRNQTAQATNDQAVSDLDGQISALEDQIKQVNAAAAGLTTQVGSLQPSVANAARAQQESLASQANDLSQQLNTLLNTRGNLVTQLAEHPTASVVDQPTPPALGVPGRRLPDVAIGALLGLLVGIILAAIIESLRPSVVGRVALARSVRAPILAELSGSAQNWSVAEVAEAAMHVEMAAAGAGVQSVELLGGDRRTDLVELAEAIAAAAPGIAISYLDTTSARAAAAPVGPDGTPGMPPGRHGLVVVVPGAMRAADLERVKDVVAISARPLLGAIVYQPPGRRPRVEEAAASQEVGA